MLTYADVRGRMLPAAEAAQQRLLYWSSSRRSVCCRLYESPVSRMRQHTSAYVSIRPHTAAHRAEVYAAAYMIDLAKKKSLAAALLCCT